MKRAIILFTRVPVPGQTKTRMMPQLTPGQCARLHACFLKDIEQVCLQTGAEIFVYYTPEDVKGVLPSVLAGKHTYALQKGADLGERMSCAISEVLGQGFGQCVLIGTDVPELTRRDLQNAFAVLSKKDVVFGPTADGGYYLVGMKHMVKQAFEKQEYGHGKVLYNTLRRLKENGVTAGLTAEHFDMDTAEDLNGFRNRARSRHPLLWTTATGRYVAAACSISVIIPVYNEEKLIIPMQRQLAGLRKHCEIIFVDGGSSDRTLERIDSRFQVIHTKKGRAHQMNAGARASHGEILFFLHCDSSLPQRPLEQIREVMKSYRVGCFGIAFHSKNLFMMTCRIISNHRIKDRKVMFGDQGIFIDRKLFFDIGMFPELPIMEDYQLSLNLKARGERIGMTKQRIYTSDRRFEGGTIVKLTCMWNMNRLRKLYRSKVPADSIAALYEDVR